MSTALTEPKKQLSMAEKLEAAIDRNAVGSIAMSAQSGLSIESMAQAMEFAKLMSLSRQAVPAHLRENPGACLAIAVQGFDLGISPFALAQKSYIVKDIICYESAIYAAVVTRRAPITGRIKMEYHGEGSTRTCRVWAVLADGTGDVEYTSPPISKITPQNSPLWKSDPDQQLYYYSVRAFTRRHFQDVMMGFYTVDEMLDAGEMVKTATPSINLGSLTSPQLVEQPAATGCVIDAAANPVAADAEIPG